MWTAILHLFIKLDAYYNTLFEKLYYLIICFFYNSLKSHMALEVSNELWTRRSNICACSVFFDSAEQQFCLRESEKVTGGQIWRLRRLFGGSWRVSWDFTSFKLFFLDLSICKMNCFTKKMRKRTNWGFNLFPFPRLYRFTWLCWKIKLNWIKTAPSETFHNTSVKIPIVDTEECRTGKSSRNNYNLAIIDITKILYKRCV